VYKREKLLEGNVNSHETTVPKRVMVREMKFVGY